MSTSVKIALIQHVCSPDVNNNTANAIDAIERAAATGAKIICLQELFNAPYFPQLARVENNALAEKLPSESAHKMSRLAKKLGIVLIVPIFEAAQPGLCFNTALIFDAGGTMVGKYRKMHIPQSPQYQEKFYFAPGDLGYPVFQTKFGKIAVGICYDQWFPEVARIFALRGAQIIFYPSAIGSEQDKPGYSSAEAWQTVMRGHAIANGLFVAAVNRVGKEGEMSFYGRSFVCDPFGDFLAKAGSEAQIVFAHLDYDKIREMRELFHFWRDRRVETYEPIVMKPVITSKFYMKPDH
jgi:N-carbamoylputrescine amidase